jgi:hypothetical protein
MLTRTEGPTSGLRHQKPELLAAYLALRCELSALRFQLALIRGFRTLEAIEAKANFDPNQPRVPSGRSEGGRWTHRPGWAESDEHATRLAQFRRGGGRRRPPFEEFIDPLAEIRTEQFGAALAKIRQLEPNNSRLTFASTLNYKPSQRDVRNLAEELEAARDRTAERITDHGFGKHADEFGIISRLDFYAQVRSTISDPSARIKQLPRDRTVFYDRASNTIVFVDPTSESGGSMFRPTPDYLRRVFSGK